jgi:hypothetical protein
MLTIKESMELAGRNLLAGLLPENDHLPLWCVAIQPDLSAKISNIWFSHNVGRWWDALLRLEAATGFPLPPEAEAAMLRHLRTCLDNRLGICCHIGNDPERKAGTFDNHSQRETLLALAVLIKYRKNDWAAEAGARMVRALDRYVLPDGRWDPDAVGSVFGRGPGPGDPRAVWSHGRMIEGLLAFYQSAGDAAALALAGRLADYHFTATTRPDGACVERAYYSGLHTHSLFGTYRGLLQYGILTRQAAFVDRVARTYRITARQQVKLSGFISHDWGKDNVGETTSPGDAAQLALWLGQLGHTELLDDAERIVRARILPSQITRPLGVRFAEGEAPTKTDPEALVLGAFGGMHTHPHGGILPTTDITAADLHTLYDIYTHIVETDEDGVRVNFHFDYKGKGVEVACREDGARRELDIRIEAARNLFVRVPRWVDRQTLELTVDNEPVPLLMVGDFACLPGRPLGGMRAVVRMNLPLQRIKEWTDNTDYEFVWRGDTVVSVRPNAPFLPFYPAEDEVASAANA